MRLVLKIGGAALEDVARVRALAAAVAALAARGHRIAVVHGGGAALTRTLKALGHESRFVDGLRVTDARTRDVALMVLAGGTNKRVVAALNAAGVRAAGVCGVDLGLMHVAKKCNGTDLGFVGDVIAVDAHWIQWLWSGGAVPVVASIAADHRGEIYNVNADEAAAAWAVGARADALVFLTDVPGVRDAQGYVVARLTTSRASALASAGAISGGMLPKLEACTRALGGGVGRVLILPAARADALMRLDDGSLLDGTEVFAP